MHVRQVPLRHERGSLTRAAEAASSNESDEGDSKVYPCGSMRTMGDAGREVILCATKRKEGADALSQRVRAYRKPAIGEISHRI